MDAFSVGDRPQQDGGRLSPLDEVRFWVQVLLDNRKTILCSPENESRVKGILAAHGIGEQIINVVVSKYVSDDRLYVVDRDKLDAERIEAVKHMLGNRGFRHDTR